MINTPLKFLLFLFIAFSSLYSSQEKAEDIAKISAKYLYEYDTESLQRVFSSDLVKNDTIYGMKIVDTLTSDIFLRYYKDGKNIIFDKKIPAKYLKFKIYNADIKYDNKIIGNLTIYVKDDTYINLTDKEKKWIKENPTITVHNEKTWAPYNFNEKGKPRGFSIEYMNLVAKIANLKVEYITGTWDELLKKIYDKELDVMLNIVKTPERLKHLLYVGTYADNISSIITKKDVKDISDIDSLNGKKVSVVRGFVYDSILSEKYPQIQLIKVDSTLDALKSVSYGNADATIGKASVSNYIMEKNGITDLKFTSDFNSGDPEVDKLNIAVRNDAPILQSILKKAMEKVPPQKMMKLKQKWLGEKEKILLSQKEQEWLDKKITVRYTYDPQWAPFEWKNELNEHTGILWDILSLVQEKSGVKFEPVHVNTWLEAIKKAKDKEIDMFSGVNETKERKEYLNFTKKSIYTTPYVFVAREKDKENYFEFKDIKNKRVGVIQGYAIEDKIKKDMPDFPLIYIQSIPEALKKLENNELDIFIVNAITAKYYINKKGFNKLRIVAKTDYSLNLKIAVRNDWDTELISIIDKSLNTIEKKELNDILFKWTEIQTEVKIDWVLIGEIIAIALIILLFVLYNNNKLKSLVALKTSELQKLLYSFDKNVIASKTDKDGKIVYVSDKFCEISGFTRKELIGKSHNVVKHPDTPDSVFKDIWRTLEQKEIWQGEIKNRKKGGGFYWVYAVITPEYDAQGNLEGYSAIRSDITAKKEVEQLSASLEIKVQERTKDLEFAKKEIEDIHQKTKDSIEYASLIQHSIIPVDEHFKKYFVDYATIWQPKDIVGGDIYLFEELQDEDKCILMVIDCTGHGVPGAFVTMLVKAIERQIITNLNLNSDSISPAKILKEFNKSVKHLLKQEHKESISNAGFDGGIIFYDKTNKIIKFAGAETPLFYIEDEELKIIKGSRHSIGYKKSDPNYEFKEHTIQVKSGMKFYLTTDGYLDQNGGNKSFPLGKRRFGEILLKNKTKNFKEQKENLLIELKKYQGDNDRNDDITLVGFEI